MRKRELKRNIKWIRAIVHTLIVVLFLPLQIDLQKHAKRRCPENDESSVKKSCVSKILMNLINLVGITVQQVYRQYDDQYIKKVESYENNGYSNLEASEKYRKGIMKQYSDILTTVHNLQRSMIHR